MKPSIVVFKYFHSSILSQILCRNECQTCFNFDENRSLFKNSSDLEAGCVDHRDVGTQGVAKEVSSAEKMPIIVTLLVLSVPSVTCCLQLTFKDRGQTELKVLCLVFLQPERCHPRLGFESVTHSEGQLHPVLKISQKRKNNGKKLRN